MAKRITALLAAWMVVGIWTLAEAQETLRFEEGLIIGPSGKRNRSAVFTDQVYHQMALGTFDTPRKGGEAGTDRDGQPRIWETIQANEQGEFVSSKLRGGLLYLTATLPQPVVKVVEVSGNSELYVNGVPRSGDIYNKKWILHPVKLNQGENSFLIKGSRGGKLKMNVYSPDKPVYFTQKDMTIPDMLVTENDEKIAAIRIVNATEKTLKGLRIETETNGEKSSMEVPAIIPLTTRKVTYRVKDNATQEGKTEVTVRLYQGGKLLDETQVTYEVKNNQKNYKRTFISEIDGSVQYFGVREGILDEGVKPAMFLSVHGAGVKGIGQAGSYKNKDWGHVIAPTNRREFGFDWEDWGRWDAMEVQALAEKMYNTDPTRTYLTGHSMGGHGTWQLGATFPGKWAALAPVSGWYSFFSYGGKEKKEQPSPVEQMFVRASHSSHTLELSRNYLHHGIYILHGDADYNVPVSQARFMKKHLAEFHPDFVYQEEPEAGHWFGIDKEPIFSYFKRHEVESNKDDKEFEFRTASPGVSSSSRFVTLYRQTEPFEFSGVKVKQSALTRREKNKEPDKVLKNRLIEVETENLEIFKLDLAHCVGADTLTVNVDGKTFEGLVDKAGGEVWFGKQNNTWAIIAKPTDASWKTPSRYGNFKDAFKHRMLFVYGTRGTKAENAWAFNKARFDAETFYYRGNGSIDVISDREFKLDKYKDRSVIIYGNATTNSAWKHLLADSPVQVKRNEITVQGKKLTGDQWATYFVRPRKDSDKASVGVVSGTGLAGFRSVYPNRYFVSGTGFPDFMLFSPDMYTQGFDGVKAAGFFGNDWSVKNGAIEWND